VVSRNLECFDFQGSAEKPNQCCAKNNNRKWHVEEEDADERHCRERLHDTVLQGPLADPYHGFEDDRQNGGFQSQEQCYDDWNVAERSVDVTQRHDRDDAGDDEKAACQQASHSPVHQPADIGCKLLCFRARQQHAVAQRMEKSILGNPSLLFDEDAMHDGDLPGGSTETE
jgi:hypothetical protein